LRLLLLCHHLSIFPKLAEAKESALLFVCKEKNMLQNLKPSNEETMKAKSKKY